VRIAADARNGGIDMAPDNEVIGVSAVGPVTVSDPRTDSAKSRCAHRPHALNTVGIAERTKNVYAVRRRECDAHVRFNHAGVEAAGCFVGLALLLADCSRERPVAEEILDQRAPIARSDERIALSREVVWNVDRSDIVSVIYTFRQPFRRTRFKLPFRRAPAPSERPIDFLIRMSSRAHLAGKFCFIRGPRLA
jgi:hypothetical protein